MTERDAIRAIGLGKTYRIARSRTRPTTVAEQVVARLRRPRRRTKVESFEALTDLNFSVPWGESVGLIGRNGAGKSTLLKLLTRITAPSAGCIELGGRVGSLLEVGTGFHPELTGRENVYLNGTLLGMKRKEIQQRFDEIVEFSGVSRFLETPVKRYSSGMYVRLAFAVAAHLETKILAVDEVLAVGDAEFQAKCLTKMRQVATDGRTVIFVSHQIQTVQELCDSAIYLENGRLAHHGAVEDAIRLYRDSFARPELTHVEASRRRGTGELRFGSATMDKESYEPTDEKRITFCIPAGADYNGSYYVSAHVVNSDGTLLLQCDSRLVGRWFDSSFAVDGCLVIREPWLRPGSYSVDLFICQSGVLDEWSAACVFSVLPVLPYGHTAAADGTNRGLVFADFDYEA